MSDNSDGLDLLPWADRRTKKPAPVETAAPATDAAMLEAVPVDIPATEPPLAEKALANGETPKPKKKRSLQKEPSPTVEEAAVDPPQAAPPAELLIGEDQALALLKHLGFKVVKHRDGTFSSTRGGTDIDGAKNFLDLLRSYYRVGFEEDEALFREWLHEQVAALPVAAPVNAAQQLARPPDELARLIREELRLGQEAAERAAAPHWFEVGKLLHEAKAQLAHGEFGDWCTRHFKISATQRARYMKAAESAVQNFRTGKYDAVSLEEHLKGTSYQTGGKAQDWAAHRDDIAERARRELDRINEAELTRHQENELRRKLVLKLIDRGYKALAAELHPDKGGSTEAMTLLNEVRDAMKRCAMT
jgi:Protein of unknown function (DUF3102)